MKQVVKGLLSLTLAASLWGGAAVAATFSATGIGADGTHLAASVSFDIVGGNLVVTLSNTSRDDALHNPDLLGAVFFDMAGNPSLSRISGELTAGSHIYVGGAQKPDQAIGGEWAYNGNLQGAPHGAKEGISAVGFSLFGSSDLFPGNRLKWDGGNPPDGPGYSLTSAGDNPSTGSGVMTTVGIIKSSVLFTLGNLPAGFDPARDISNVSFQYGTTLTDANITPPGTKPPGVPDGASTLALVGLTLLGLNVLRRTTRWG